MAIWKPIIDFLGSDKYVPMFMYMGTTKVDGVTLYLYKGINSRKNINVTGKGKAYKYVILPAYNYDRGIYEPITKKEALKVLEEEKNNLK